MTPDFRTITEIKEANCRSGGHFFERSTMRFFDSRVLRGVYGGRYFVTSEQFHSGTYSAPRRYSIREAGADGDVDTVGEFQAYATAAEARREARRLAGEAR